VWSESTGNGRKNGTWLDGGNKNKAPGRHQQIRQKSLKEGIGNILQEIDEIKSESHRLRRKAGKKFWGVEHIRSVDVLDGGQRDSNYWLANGLIRAKSKKSL